MRPLGPEHLHDMVALYRDPVVTRFLAPMDEAVQSNRLRESEESWVVNGYGRVAIYDAGGETFLGRGGLQYWPQFHEVELGWVLRREAWGCGYATESARAWLEWGFEHLDVEYLTANIHPDNTASTAVARRLGMSPLRQDIFHGRTVVIHAIHRNSS